MDSMPTNIPLIDSVSTLADGYDVWLCDVWGVLHNGERTFASAAAACQQFRAGGGSVVLISNSPRPRQGVAGQLDLIGVPADVWDVIVTSGDVTKALIVEASDKKLFHLGPERDLGLFEGLDINFAGPDDADLVICSGLYDDETEGPDDYADLLMQLKVRELPLICANPDLMVERGERLIYCAGALAAAYTALGGEVIYGGKPHPPIYEQAFREAAQLRGAPVDRKRVLAIGDGLKTDIAGAASAGIDALFVASGLHLAQAGSQGTADAEAIANLFAEASIRPLAAQTRLVW